MNWQWLLLPLAPFFVGLTVKRGWLSPAGAVAAYILGSGVVVLAGWRWVLPLFLFMLSSVALARAGSSPATDAKHGRGRDALQVVCNGGIYGLCALGAYLQPTAGWWLLMSVSIAVSTADTWASEIGIGRGGATYDLLRWYRLPVGVSGGVSVAGTVGGLAGAAAIATLHRLLHPAGIGEMLLIMSAGFGGMLIDSLLGASLQARYRENDSGRLRDTAGTQTYLYSGWKGMSNDGVNLLANALTTGAVLALGSL